MAEILQLFSMTRHLYQPDVLPLAQLQLESSQNCLRERYRFSSTAATGLQLFASGGAFQRTGSSVIVPVQQIVFASNTIDVQVAGDTTSAEELQQDLIRFLSEISTIENPRFPEYARSVQTLAIVKLDVSIESAFSDKLKSYIANDAFPAFKLEDADVHMQLAHLQWVIGYTRKSTDYGYEPKLFTVEPRFGTRLGDGIYYTQSPTDSETHMKLLQRFEEAMK